MDSMKPLQSFLFPLLDLNHSVQLFALIKFLKFPLLDLVTPTFVLP